MIIVQCCCSYSLYYALDLLDLFTTILKACTLKQHLSYPPNPHLL